jgi:hypothetical protein
MEVKRKSAFLAAGGSLNLNAKDKDYFPLLHPFNVNNFSLASDSKAGRIAVM